MKATVVELTTGDLPEAVRFIVHEINQQRGTTFDAAASMSRYRWLLEENPRRRGSFIGWGLRNEAGGLVGTNLCMWQHYRRGGETAVALHSGDYYVSEAARGPASLGLLLNMMRHQEADLAMCCTANVNGAKVWQAIRGIPIPGGEYEVLLPVNFGPLAAGAMARRLPWRWLRRMVTSACSMLPQAGPRYPVSGDVVVESLRPEDCAAVSSTYPGGEFWEPQRDEAWLRWRYFSNHSSRACSLLRVSKQSGGSDIFLGTHLGSRGEGRKVRSLTVMDAWGRLASFSAPEVIGALVKYFRGKLDVINLRLMTAELWKGQLPSARVRPLESITHWIAKTRHPITPGDWRFTMADGDACA